MKDYLIAFVIMFLGSMAAAWLSAALARWANKRFPLLAQSCSPDPAQAFPKAWCLRTAAWGIFLVWGCIVALVSLPILVSVGVVFNSHFLDSLGIATFAILFSTSALSITIASIIHCPKCKRHLLIQWTEHPPFAEKTKLGVDAWAAIVLRAGTNQNFQCMYCGQHFLMKPEVLHSPANA